MPCMKRLSALRANNIFCAVKGYVAVTGKPMRYLLQAVGERVRGQFDQPWGDALRTTQLVLIAEHDHINLDAIHALLAD